MKKLFTLSACLMLLCMGLHLQAQPVRGSGLNRFLASKESKSSMDGLFVERYALENIDGREYISVIMRVNAKSDLSFLNKYDCRVGSRSGRIVSLRVNTSQLASLAREKDILEIETARKLSGPTLDNARVDLRANDVHNAVDLLQAYTGKDVIVGICDWGIDYSHPTFYDTLMENTRILAAWDQYRTAGPAPEGYDYGTLIEGQENLLAAGCDTSNIYDYGVHQTHCMNIAAGTGAGTSYRGLAYEANLLSCTFICDEAHYMDAVNWMKTYAKAQGKRLVVGNSWGVYIFGSMDGNSMLDEFINTTSEEDSVVFVISAGNTGSDNYHIMADFSQNSADTARSEVEFSFPDPGNANYWGEIVTMEGVNSGNFSSRIEAYDYAWNLVHASPWIQCGGNPVDETVYMLEDDDSLIYRASTRQVAGSSAPMADWEIRMSKYTSNTNHIVLAIKADSGVVHAWNVAYLTKAIGNWGLQFKASRDGYLAGDSQYGIGEPGVAEKAITVAAHRFRANHSWTPQIAYFSSRGPVIGGYQKPDISAPGHQIVSAISSYSSEYSYTDSVSFNDRTYGFAALSGTSMSGPMVTGTVALMLQANPSLTSEEIKQIITSTAKTDTYTTDSIPNITWGYGKLDTWAAVKQAERTVSIENTAATDLGLSVYPVPADETLYIKGLQGKALAVIFDAVGRQVAFIHNTDGRIDIKNLKTGVYLLNINTENGAQNIKFIKK